MKLMILKIIFTVGIGGIAISIGIEDLIGRLIGLFVSTIGISWSLDCIIKNIIEEVKS